MLYTLGSKLYSWKVTRVKKRPIAGWLGVGLIQGALTFVAVVQSVGTPRWWSDPALWAGALTAALFLWGVYPMTQIYQHREDERHGDLTLSRLVGVRGTFVVAALFLGAAVASFVALFVVGKGWSTALFFLGLQSPTLVYFLWWAFDVWKGPGQGRFSKDHGAEPAGFGNDELFFCPGLLAVRAETNE